METPHAADAGDRDEIEVLLDVSWAQYEERLAARDGKRRPRLFYLDGALEVMTTSLRHERVSFNIGLLLVTYAVEAEIELSAWGSTTQRDALKRVGAEPDTSFSIGLGEKPQPDLAVEVVVTSGGVKKLEIYRRLGVSEVWVWIEGVIHVYVLTADRYVGVSRSHWLPSLDLELLATFLEYTHQTTAARDYRAALAARR